MYIYRRKNNNLKNTPFGKTLIRRYIENNLIHYKLLSKYSGKDFN